MTNTARAMVKMQTLLSELDFRRLEEDYPHVFDVLRTKLIEDEIKIERVRYQVDNNVTNLKEEVKFLRKFYSEAFNLLKGFSGKDGFQKVNEFIDRYSPKRRHDDKTTNRDTKENF